MSKTFKDRPYRIRQAEHAKKRGESFCAACDAVVMRRPDDFSALFYADDHKGIQAFIDLAEKHGRTAVARELKGYLFRTPPKEIFNHGFRRLAIESDAEAEGIIDSRRILLSEHPQKGDSIDPATILFGEGEAYMDNGSHKFNVFVEVTAIADLVASKPFHWHGWQSTRFEYGRCHCSSCLGENKNHIARRHDRDQLHSAMRNFNSNGLEGVEEMDFV